jgi:hypothetical protein
LGDFERYKELKRLGKKEKFAWELVKSWYVLETFAVDSSR